MTIKMIIAEMSGRSISVSVKLLDCTLFTEKTNAFRELVQEVNDGEQQSDSTVEEDAGA